MRAVRQQQRNPVTLAHPELMEPRGATVNLRVKTAVADFGTLKYEGGAIGMCPGALAQEMVDGHRRIGERGGNLPCVMFFPQFIQFLSVSSYR
ncbi:MAG: hypothetical protein BWY71_01960 [Planctomycetes bacterium ADurb.Bin412]|nr:MAG: hypothetical protein BWY71_01960 [Planctomycetes bacterium ADurb.Bin412]